MGTAGWRQVVRGLRRSPSFTLVAVVTLALGIGATTAVYTVLHAVVLSPLPYPEPDRLVRLYSGDVAEPQRLEFLPAMDFVDYRDGVDAFASAAAFYDYQETGMDLTGRGAPRRVRSLTVSAGYFDVYGVQPSQGRGFTAEDELGPLDGSVGGSKVVVSHALGRSLGDGDRDLLGTTLQLDGEAYTVVGVMPAGFTDPVVGAIDLWVPLNLDPEGRWNQRSNWYLSSVARLADDATVDQARAQVDAVMARIRTEFPDSHETQAGRVVPLFDDVVGATPRMLWILMAAAGVVLLIAAVNVANLLVARGLARRRELAVRAALGSGRGRLTRQLLLESGLLALAGGAAGWLLAWGGVRALLAVSPDSVARVGEVSFDPLLLLFALAVTGVTAILFGLAPALHFARTSPARVLREGSRGSDGRGTGRWRSGLVTLQVALATVLLMAAGALLQSFAALTHVPLGFEPEGVLTFEVHLPDGRYEEGPRRIAFHRQLHEAMGGLPGVVEVGAVSKLPASGAYNIWGAARYTEAGVRDWLPAQVRVVEGDYFGALSIPVLRGRTVGPEDLADGEPVMAINRTLAEQLWPGEDPLGRTVFAANADRRIVGVVEDVPHDHLGTVGPKVYVSHGQMGANRNWALAQVVRVEGDPAAVAPTLRRELAGLDPELVLYQPMPLTDLVGKQRAFHRFLVLLMSLFGLVALTLAAVGIYGVLAQAVAGRTREIGIRMALGARAAQVLRAVVGGGLSWVVLGLGAGVLLSQAAGRLLESLLFDGRVWDPSLLAAVLGILGAVALMAALGPAARALRIAPMEALRKD